MDLTQLSDEDLMALKSGDLSRVSDAGLVSLKGPQSSYNPKKWGADAPGALRGALSVMNGPLMGWGDELIGALGGGVRTLQGNGSFNENYTDIRDFVRGAQDQEKKTNPIVTPVLQAVASMPLSLLGKAKAATSMFGQTKQAAASGGLWGGVSGGGNSEATDPIDVLFDTGLGAGLGAGTSGAAVPLMRATGAAVRTGAAAINDSAAANYAKQKVSEAFARDSRGNFFRDSPAALGQATARMSTLGPEAAVVDAGGGNTRQLLDTLATLPGRTKDTAEAFIRSRQAGRAGRLIGAAETGLNPSGLRLQETVDDIVARRAENAIPLYEKLYKTGVFVDEELQGIISAADRLGAGGQAKQIAIAKQVPYTLSGDVKWAPMRQLDYLKQGLDDIIKANTDITGHVNKVGASVQGLKTDLLRVLDQQTKGAYKQAREAFAGPSALIDAAQSGRKFWATDDQAISKTLSTMTEGEREAFRIGAYESLRAKMGVQSGQTQILNMWREPATREKLQALFGDERGFRDFAATAAKEARLKLVEGVGRGSQTAARQYGAGDLDMQALQSVGDAATSAASGHPLSFLSSASNAWNRVKTPERLRDQMGEVLLSQGSKGQRGLLDLQTVFEKVQRDRARQAGLLGLEFGGAAGSFAEGLLP